MRQIKFRLWDEIKYKYFKPLDKGVWFNVTHEGNVIVDEYGKREIDAWDSEDYVLEQYTGLKDRNGQKIYEGDILYYGQDDEDNDIYGPVIYLNGMFQHGDDEPIGDGYAEIIGNIHYNPELLEKEGE